MPTSPKPKTQEKRTTQKDLAVQLGLAQSTVSMALRRHPDIPQKTIERVLHLAKQTGYTPDPYLSGLAAYRKKLSPPHYTATVAWLSVVPTSWSWRDSRIYTAYHDGACERASELGYRIEEHILNLEAGNANSLKRILHARKIQGILVPPLPGYNNTLEFDFSRFYVVTFGYTLQNPKLHLVSHQHFQSARVAMEKLHALGYRRIAFVINAETDLRTYRGWSAGVRSFQSDLPQAECIPLFLPKEYKKKTILDWYHRVKPDAILTQGTYIYDYLTGAGITIPGDVGYAVLDAWRDQPQLTGMDQNAHATGARAIELLIEKLNIQEMGVPDITTHVLVEGTWIEGKSLRES